MEINTEKTASSIEFSHETLKEKILQKTREAAELQEIIQKQLENINELQKKSEESFIVINHLPQSKLIASERFENAMKLSDFVKKKQVQVSELLNIAMKEIDETVGKTNKLRGQLASDVQLANQRVMIYNSNLNQIKNLRDMITNSVRNNMSAKISQMNLMKDFLDANNEQKMHQKLCELNSRISHIDSLNSKIEEELSQDNLVINTIEEKSKSKEEDFINMIKTMDEKLQIIVTKYKEGEQEFSTILNEISTLQSTNQELNKKFTAMSVELLEKKEKENTTKQELLSKNGAMDAIKNELEKSILDCRHLREKVKIVSESEEESRLLQGHLSEFEEQKGELLDNQKKVIDKIDLSKHLIEEVERNLHDKNSCIDRIKVSYNNSLIKVNQLKETDAEERNSFQKILLEINKEINELQIKKVNSKDSFTTKSSKLEELRTLLTNEKEESKMLKNELNDIREVNQNRKTSLSKSLSTSKIKFNELCEEIELQDLEFKEKNQKRDETSALSEEIRIQKEKLADLFVKFEKEKNDLKSSFCDHFESQHAELQKVKEEKRSALEKVKDNASKAEFMYYRLKRTMERHLYEKNYLKDTLKSYNCENEISRMAVDWLKSNDANIVNTNSESSVISDEGSQTTKLQDKGLTSEKQDAEELEPYNEMQIHDYQAPTPVKAVPEMKNQEIQGEMKVPPLPKRFLKREATASVERAPGDFSIWKKPKKDIRKKTILDLVVESTDSQSS